MTDDDVDEGLKEKWIEIFNPNNDKLINQQMDEFTDLIDIQDNAHKLKYRGKLYFVIGHAARAPPV
jgi:hypothetical protein